MERKPADNAAAVRSVALAALEDDVRGEVGPDARLVFGKGNPAAPLAVVGEAPGPREEKRGRPFVGPAGRLLDHFLDEFNILRSDLWITNMVKWRPTQGEGAQARTRAPRAADIRQHTAWLRRELDIMRPRILLCLGNVAARAIIGRRFAMNADHGRWFELGNGVTGLATFHPAYVLRQDDNMEQVMRLVHADFEAVREHYQALAAGSRPSPAGVSRSRRHTPQQSSHLLN